MAQLEHWFDQDIKKPVKVHHISGNMFSQDAFGNLIGVRVFDHGEPLALSGSVSANVIRPDGGTVAVTGSLSENTACVELPEAAYAYPGMIAIVLKLTSGSVVTTLCAVTAIVYRSSTDTIIDPGTIVPSIQSLIADINTAVDSIPLDYSALNQQVSVLTNSVEYFDVYDTFGVAWEQGTISSSSGSYSSSDTRVRTGYVKCENARGFRVIVPDGYKVNALLYNTNAVSGYVGRITSDWATTDFDIKVNIGQYIRCVCAYDNDANITPEDLPHSILYIINYTDADLLQDHKAADASSVREQINHEFSELQNGLYLQQYDRTVRNIVWESGMIRPVEGDLYGSTKHIRTSYIPIYNNIPVEISAPDTIKCIIFKYGSQTITDYYGYDRDYMPGKQRQSIDTAYIRIVAANVDGTNISPEDAENIVVSTYTDNQKRKTDVADIEMTRILHKKNIETTWVNRKISPTNGGYTADDGFISTGYIKISKGNTFRIDYPEGMKISVFEYDMQGTDGYEGTLIVDSTAGYFLHNVATDAYIKVMASYTSGEDIDPEAGEEVVIVHYYENKELNILVLGNSFSMDSFAYLPPVLNEMIPGYTINYGVVYTASASISDHVSMYNNNTKYTLYWEWDYKTGRWKHWTSTGQYDRGKTLTDVMALRDWSIIYTQPATNVTDPQNIIDNVITPGRQLLRILQSLAHKPFTFLMGEWLGTDRNGDHGAEVFGLISDAMEMTKRALGIDGYIPIGAAVQDARTISTLQSLGTTGNMLYDGQHMQSGIAPLIATYTIAVYIARMIGFEERNPFALTFEPTTENCIEINAWHTGNPTPMTHGESVGVTDANIKAAQEIAVIANNYPNEVVDCSNLII